MSHGVAISPPGTIRFGYQQAESRPDTLPPTPPYPPSGAREPRRTGSTAPRRAPASEQIGPTGKIPAPAGDGIWQLGPLKLHAYGALIGMGAIGGGLAFTHYLKRANVPTKGLAKVVVPALAAGIVGARLYHVATHPDDYRGKLGDVPKIWEGGMAIYGGVAAGTLVGAAMARHAGLKISPLLDAAALALPVAQAVGRWGNYENQELFGTPTDKPWGLQVDPEHRPAGYENYNSFHPTFLYESVWDVGLAGGLYALSKTWKNRPPGVLFATYLAGYGAGRFAIESIRTDTSESWGGLRTNQWASLATMGVAGIGALALVAKGKMR